MKCRDDLISNGMFCLLSLLLHASRTTSWAAPATGSWGVADLVVNDTQIQPSSDDAVVLLQRGYKFVGPSSAEFSAPLTEPITTWHAIQTLEEMGAHPFWHLEMDKLWHIRVIPCCVVMAIAGILCSAGGIGGGAIYVSVLMVVGQIPLFDAVPLSQAVIFLGSIPTMLMNVRKGRESPRRLIDYDICRVVVPLSLSGTFLGVILNRRLPGWLTLSVLCGVLIFMTISMVCETRQQYVAECKATAMLSDCSSEGGSDGGSISDAGGGSDGGRNGAMLNNLQLHAGRDKGTGLLLKKLELHALEGEAPDHLTWGDIGVLTFMLAVVIVAGALRFHATRCVRSPKIVRTDYCNHRALFWLPFGTMEHLVFARSFATLISVMALVVPLALCGCVGLAYAAALVNHGNWKFSGVAIYSSMAFGTGIISGLLGIGGGLIFSPFFLLMGQPPAVAVATSSTCVLISSSSSAMQYLLTDRVVVSLAFLYGVINLMASSIGTKLVHCVQDRMGTSKPMISGIVAFGVLISTLLTMMKVWSELASHLVPETTTPVPVTHEELFQSFRISGPLSS